jgi:hypothetical protein
MPCYLGRLDDPRALLCRGVCGWSEAACNTYSAHHVSVCACVFTIPPRHHILLLRDTPHHLVATALSVHQTAQQPTFGAAARACRGSARAAAALAGAVHAVAVAVDAAGAGCGRQSDGGMSSVCRLGHS